MEKDVKKPQKEKLKINNDWFPKLDFTDQSKKSLDSLSDYNDDDKPLKNAIFDFLLGKDANKKQDHPSVKYTYDIKDKKVNTKALDEKLLECKKNNDNSTVKEVNSDNYFFSKFNFKNAPLINGNSDMHAFLIKKPTEIVDLYTNIITYPVKIINKQKRRQSLEYADLCISNNDIVIRLEKTKTDVLTIPLKQIFKYELDKKNNLLNIYQFSIDNLEERVYTFECLRIDELGRSIEHYINNYTRIGLIKENAKKKKSQNIN